MKHPPQRHLKRRQRQWQAFQRRVGRIIYSAHADAPSFHDAGVATTQEPGDALDEAVMESFPASDPPAVHRRQMP